MVISKRQLLPGLAVIVWLVWWLWISRYHLLDDVLIHLRYAETLWNHHRLSFDGLDTTFGTSSILFVSLLALVHGLVGSILVPKVLSIASYLGLLTMVGLEARKAKSVQRHLWTGLLIVFISPMAIRWLSDGMETSLVGLTVLVVAIVSYRSAKAQTSSLSRYAALTVLGAVLVVLRVELALIAAFSTAAILVYHFERQMRIERWTLAVYSVARIAGKQSHLIVGALLAALAIFLLFDQLLPDTAVAKSGAEFGLADGVRRILNPIASSLTLGLGLLLVWLISTLAAFKHSLDRRQGLWLLITVNSLFLVLFGAIVIRGQAVEGVRHVVWVLIYVIAWTIMQCPAAFGPVVGAPSRFMTGKNTARAGVIAILVIISVGWAVEGYHVARIVRDRSQAFMEMRSQGLDTLSGRPGVAFDVGFVSYFSKGLMCDVKGLVNGNDFAKLSREGRAERCAAKSPEFAFVTPSQAGFLDKYLTMDTWVVCYRYEFTNLRATEPHYLLVEPEVAAGFCPKLAMSYGNVDLE